VDLTKPELMEKISKAKGLTLHWHVPDMPGDPVTI
jgi:hypothetical protein